MRPSPSDPLADQSFSMMPTRSLGMKRTPHAPSVTRPPSTTMTSRITAATTISAQALLVSGIPAASEFMSESTHVIKPPFQ